MLKSSVLFTLILAVLILSACPSVYFEAPKEEAETPTDPGSTDRTVLTGLDAKERLGPDRQARLTALEERYGSEVDLTVNAETGFVTLLRFVREPTASSETAATETRARQFLQDNLSLLAPIGRLSDFIVVENGTECYTPDDDSEAPSLGGTYRFTRMLEGIPVAGDDLLVRFGANGAVRQIENYISAVDLESVSVQDFDPDLQVLSQYIPDPKAWSRVAGTAQDLLVPVQGDIGTESLQLGKLISWSDASGEARSLIALSGGDVLGPWGRGVGSVEGNVHIDPMTGLPDFISFRGEGGRSVPGAGHLADPAQIAFRFLEANKEMFRTGRPVCQFQTVRSEVPAYNPAVSYVRLEQTIAGRRVDGAELVFEIVDGKIMSVAGHVLPEAAMPLTPSISKRAAADLARSALLEYGSRLPTDQAADFQERVGNAQVVGNELVIHPGQLLTGDVDSSRLAYKVSIPNYALLVDAITGNVIFAHSLQTSANIVRDGAGTGVNPVDQSAYVTINIDGVPQPLPPGFVPNADVPQTTTDLGGNAAFFAAHGWFGLNGRGSDLVAITNVTMGGCPNNAFFDFFLSHQAYFCLGAGRNDLVTHEFTHGVLANSSRLIYLDESGALNESYADIMGNRAFPDAVAAGAGWLVGETTVGGAAVRNMANPAAFGDPATWAGYLSRSDLACPAWDVIGLTGACDFGGVHSNSGINNRAHVLLSDGRAGRFTGIGRPKMGTLAFDVMTRRLTPFARMIDAAMLTRESCALFASTGAIAIAIPPATPPVVFAPQDCDIVPLAFEAVGLDPDYIGDWEPRVLGFSGTIPRFTGEVTDNGCVVNDVQLQMDTPSGRQDASVATGGPTPTINYLGLATATIPTTTPPIGTTGKAHIINWTNDFGFSPSVSSSVSTVNPPPGQVSCNAPAGTIPVNRHSATRAHTIIPDGFGGTTTIGLPASTMNPACALTGTEVELVDARGSVLAGPGTTARFTKEVWVPTPFLFPVPVDVSIAATVVPPLPTGPPNLSAAVNWNIDPVGYFDIRFRLHYHVNQPATVTCTP